MTADNDHNVRAKTGTGKRAGQSGKTAGGKDKRPARTDAQAATTPKADAGEAKAQRVATREARRAANQQEREARRAEKQAQRAAGHGKHDKTAADGKAKAAKPAREKVPADADARADKQAQRAAKRAARDRTPALGAEKKAEKQAQQGAKQANRDKGVAGPDTAAKADKQAQRAAKREKLASGPDAAAKAGKQAQRAMKRAIRDADAEDAEPEARAEDAALDDARDGAAAAAATSMQAAPVAIPTAQAAPAPAPSITVASVQIVPVPAVPVATSPMPGPAAKVVEPRGAVTAPRFNILIVGQNGRLGTEAVLFAASLRRNSPRWQGRLIVAEPRPDAAWSGVDTLMPAPVRAALAAFGAEIRPFTATHFGAAYPYGNKIEALSLLPPNEPFIFFDSDTLITGELARLDVDFARPSASMRREGTWPTPPLYGPGYTEIWQSLYDRFGLDFTASLDLDQPDEHWERYLYFNAGWFLGADPRAFAQRFLEYATAIRNEPGEALACQTLDPWLDQVALPLTVHALGGGRPGPGLDGLDGAASCHYRNLSLLYAREPDAVLDLIEELVADPRIAPLLQDDEAVARLIKGGEGRRVIRPIFAGQNPPATEQAMRHRLRRDGLWFR